MGETLRRGLYIALAAGLSLGLMACEKESKDAQASTPTTQGNENQGGEDGAPLKLSKTQVEAIAGKPCEAAITQGSGEYKKPTVDPADILEAEVKDGKLVLTVKKAGTAKVTLTDSKTSKTAELKARTYMLEFDWAAIPRGTFTLWGVQTAWGSPQSSPSTG